MGYSFYQTTRSGNKYVLKEKFVEFQEVSAINKYNKMFNDIISKKLAKHKTLEQAIGFLRIPDGNEKLDMTAIHPESYQAAEKILEKLGFTKDAIGTDELKDAIKKANRKHKAAYQGS